MNKVILGLILAVCLLGMALVMLNERLGRQTETASNHSAAVVENRIPDDLNFPDTPVDVNPPLPPASETAISPLPDPENAENAGKLELAEASAALEAPLPEDSNKTIPVAPPAVNAPTPAKPPLVKTGEAEKPEAEKTVQVEKAAQPRTVQEKPSVQTADKKKERTVNRFVIFSREKGATIRIGGTSRIHYTSMTLDNPDRIVVDMDGQWQFPPSPGVPKNEMVSNVRIGKNGDKTRVVIDLKEKPRIVRVLPSRNGDSLDVRVDK